MLLGTDKIRKPVPFLPLLSLRLADTVMSIQNGILDLCRWLLYKKNPNPKHILIFRTGSLGDSICSIPSIKSIGEYFPKAKIDILTNAGRANLVGLPYLLPPTYYQKIIDYSGYSKKELLNILKTENYDLVIQLTQVDAGFISLLRDLFVFRFVAASGWGWKRSQSKLFRQTQARWLEFDNEPTRLKKILATQGIVTKQEGTILNCDAEIVAAAADFIASLNIPAGRKMIAVVTGSKRLQNRWPIESFRKLIEVLAADYAIVLVGSKEEEELVQPLLSVPNTYNACGKLLPMQSAALLQKAVLTISNDTGPMHLSYAVGTPTIALFSSRDLPGKWYPEGKKNIVFRTYGVHCEACFSETCSNNICMQAIKADEVIAAAKSLLSVQKDTQ